jgi:hypothetical protein
MGSYAVYLHMDLLEAVPARGAQRDMIMRFIRSLAEDPFAQADLVDQDDTLRQRQIRIIGEYAITYWVDHPAKAVMIVSVEPADR